MLRQKAIYPRSPSSVPTSIIFLPWVMTSGGLRLAGNTWNWVKRQKQGAPGVSAATLLAQVMRGTLPGSSGTPASPHMLPELLSPWFCCPPSASLDKWSLIIYNSTLQPWLNPPELIL